MFDTIAGAGRQHPPAAEDLRVTFLEYLHAIIPAVRPDSWHPGLQTVRASQRTLTTNSQADTSGNRSRRCGPAQQELSG
jgi:hypothetical protein